MINKTEDNTDKDYKNNFRKNIINENFKNINPNKGIANNKIMNMMNSILIIIIIITKIINKKKILY